MSARVSLTFEGETMVDVYTAMRRELARVEGNHAGLIPPPDPTPIQAAPSYQQPGAAPVCPLGHGPLAYRPAGTTRSGPRVGQPYPAFWSCARQDCSVRQEVATP